MGFARWAAEKSKDPSTKVGAVIVDPSNRIVSVGFNGPPRGVPDDAGIDRETKLMRTLHAEQNAILFAQRDLSGCSLYVTHVPCARCAAMIVQTGIIEVNAPQPDDAFLERWRKEYVEAGFMFHHAGVQLRLT